MIGRRRHPSCRRAPCLQGAGRLAGWPAGRLAGWLAGTPCIPGCPVDCPGEWVERQVEVGLSRALVPGHHPAGCRMGGVGDGRRAGVVSGQTPCCWWLSPTGAHQPTCLQAGTRALWSAHARFETNALCIISHTTPQARRCILRGPHLMRTLSAAASHLEEAPPPPAARSQRRPLRGLLTPPQSAGTRCESCRAGHQACSAASLAARP